jgi:integrase
MLSKLVAAVPAIIRNPYNASLLKAMMSLAYYCFLRIGEIAVKNRQDTQKVIQINDVHFEEGTDKTTKPSC